MPEPIIQSRVVEIAELHDGDQVRATLTEHGLYGLPLARATNQLEGMVHSTYKLNTQHFMRLELLGEITTHTIGSHWTIELLDRVPGTARAAVGS